MKPREFDDLIKQKFDENDFEYNPRNWERLEDQLEGRSKKRSIIMWWWMPLVGVAASVAALAIGINFMWRQAATGDAGVSGFACNIPCQHSQPLQIQESAPLAINNVVPKNHKNKKAGTVHSSDNKEEIFNINLQNALSFNQAKKENKFISYNDDMDIRIDV